jgi:hypothetical protein
VQAGEASPAPARQEGGRVTYAELIQDVLARLVAAREEADPYERDRILADLELDVLAALEWREAA